MSKITTEFTEGALRNGIVIAPGKRSNSGNPAVAHAAAIEMANLGFIVNPTELQGFSTKALEQMLKDARKVIGADRAMTPIYPGFPQQVESMDTMTLLLEQILHYWTAGAFLPNYPTVARKGLPIADMLRNARELKVLTASEAASSIIEKMATAPIAISQGDKELLRGALALHRVSAEEIAALVKKASNGENMQNVLIATKGMGFKDSKELLLAALPGCANADQVLRAVLALYSKASNFSHEDNYTVAVENLADRHARAVAMENMPREARRAVIKRLGEVTGEFRADALVSRTLLWRRVMRSIHPFDLKPSGEETRALDIIHGNVQYRTLNSLVEEAMEQGDAATAAELLAAHQPGNLLRRLVAILRLVSKASEADALAKAVKETAPRASLSTLISSYNGVISANDDHARVNRVAGVNNTMLQREVAKVAPAHLAKVSRAILEAMTEKLKSTPAPLGAVGILSDAPVPLVRRDAATTDRVLDRGQELTPVGSGDVLRVFGHWNNNQNRAGYMDIGVVVMDSKFNIISVSTWDTWTQEREWSTYSGDKMVTPDESAAEFFDIKVDKLLKKYPEAAWLAMTVQSWSGFSMADVDFIAGLMYRSKAKEGEVFDARTVESAFKPTTTSTQSVPYAFNLKTGKMTWIDSSNGSTASGVSSSNDDSIGDIVYDEIARERLTMGQLAELYALAHGAETVKAKVDRDTLLSLLG